MNFQSLLVVSMIIVNVVVGVASMGEKPGKGELLTRMLKPKSHLRTKRSIFDFRRMINCETGRSALDYNGYGCWCGYGGRGTPVDGVDRCCKTHDGCYDNAKCSSIYFNGYSRKGCSDCDSTRNDACEQALCECDRDAARCFRNNYFDPKYKNHSQSKC